MASKTLCRRLAARIRHLLEERLFIDDQLQHYIDSTYLNPSDAALKEMFDDAASSDIASLFELVFSPDEGFQAAVEDDLQRGGFTPGDQRQVTEALLERPLEVRLVFLRRPLSLAVAMPPENAERFVELLHIGRKADPGIVKAANRFLDPASRNHVMVMLPNAKESFTENEVHFLIKMIEKSGPELSGFQACLNLVLSLLREHPDPFDMYRLLTEQKRMHLKNLKNHQRLESQIRGHNMETVLLKGLRIPYLDAAEARNQVALIDTLTHAVFGKIPLSGEGRAVEHREENTDIETIDRLIQYLS